MSMPIGTVNQLVSVIQAQLSARAPAAKRPAGRGAGKSGAARYARENLAGLIELRIGQIGRDDAQRGRKALRVFLEAVLLSHFGEQLLNDPGFFQMVDDVQHALESDPACASMIATAIGELLRPDA